MDTPYQWTKQVASHWGGTRNGTIVHWPNGITAKGELRSQFHHVIDVAPTILEVAGLPEPVAVNGVQQMPLHGVEHGLLVRRRAAPRSATRRSTSRCSCNRGIYHKGWTAVTRHSTPWVAGRAAGASTTTCGSSTRPTTGPRRTTSRRSSRERLHELQRLFLIEAVKYNVLPLDDRRVERFNADLAGRPQLVRGNSQLLFGGMGRLTENSIVVLKNKSHAVTAAGRRARVRAPSGVIVAQGGAFGGWSLYAKDGKPAYCYNLFGLQRFKVDGERRCYRPASTRCGWSSPTTAAGSARAARSRSSSTGARSARAASTRPSRCSSRPTRRPTSAATARRR